MSRFQIYLLPVLACGLFLVTGSMEQTAAPVLSIRPGLPEQPLTAWVAEPVPLPAHWQGGTGAEILKQATDKCSADQIAWLDMTFHQRVRLDNLDFEMEGRFLAAPDQRSRFELKLMRGSQVSRRVVIVNGQSLIEVVDLPGNDRQINSVDLPKVQKPGDDPAAVAQARMELLQTKTFTGMPALLHSLQLGLTQMQCRGVKVHGREFLEIRGKWVSSKSASAQVPKELRLQATPRECRIYLDASSLWVCCVEWWGGVAADRPPQLLVQTIYDTPRLNQPLTAEQMVQAMTAQ